LAFLFLGKKGGGEKICGLECWDGIRRRQFVSDGTDFTLTLFVHFGLEERRTSYEKN
jgi:hypothetical protein